MDAYNQGQETGPGSRVSPNEYWRERYEQHLNRLRARAEQAYRRDHPDTDDHVTDALQNTQGLRRSAFEQFYRDSSFWRALAHRSNHHTLEEQRRALIENVPPLFGVSSVQSEEYRRHQERATSMFNRMINQARQYELERNYRRFAPTHFDNPRVVYEYDRDHYILICSRCGHRYFIPRHHLAGTDLRTLQRNYRCRQCGAGPCRCPRCR